MQAIGVFTLDDETLSASLVYYMDPPSDVVGEIQTRLGVPSASVDIPAEMVPAFVMMTGAEIADQITAWE